MGRIKIPIFLSVVTVILILCLPSFFNGRNAITTHITTLAELQAMESNLSEDYILDNDIDASATSGWNGGLGFDPVGNLGTEFTGSFDGQGFTIMGLTINRPLEDYVGLFGRTNNAGTIQNVNLVNCVITGKRYVGGLIGHQPDGTVENCSVDGNITGESIVGGLVGRTSKEGDVSDCHTTGTVQGEDDIGGLIAYNSGDVTDCYSECTVLGTRDSVGGLIGKVSSDGSYSIILGCHATGDVTGGEDEIGGLIGENFKAKKIFQCYASGKIEGPDELGGLIGKSIISTVSECYALGDVESTGLFGQIRIGGLIGNNLESEVSDCYAEGSVVGKEEVGGLVGRNSGSISECYSIGTATGDMKIGGLAGRSYGSISNCYAKGNAVGGDEVGGLVGENSDDISNSYSIGIVTGGVDIGGLIGDNSGTVSNSFWDTETSGQATSDGGTGRTTEQMQTRSTFTDAGWDFDTIWNICELPSYFASYPWLRWQGSLVDICILAIPVAEFSGTPTSGYVPLTVQFTDLSTNTPTSWLWDFGDGETSTEENPLHTYATAGTYTVTLTATNAAGSDDEVKVDYITVLSGDPASPTDLRLSQCPQEFNPIEIKQGKPRFSAIYNDPNTGDIANNYQIQVNINSSFTGTEMWNSGKTSMDNLDEGERCPEILYQGIELTEDGTTYYWRIKFWDDEDNEGDWSDPGMFTMAGVKRRDSLLLPIRESSLERSALLPIRELSLEREILLPSDN